jgi:hypothetical protein
VQLAILGDQVFTSYKPNLASNPLKAGVYLISLIIYCVLAAWAIVLHCNTLAEVQGFRSAWSGLLNIILAAIAIFIPIMAVIFVLATITGR